MSNGPILISRKPPGTDRLQPCTPRTLLFHRSAPFTPQLFQPSAPFTPLLPSPLCSLHPSVPFTPQLFQPSAPFTPLLPSPLSSFSPLLPSALCSFHPSGISALNTSPLSPLPLLSEGHLGMTNTGEGLTLHPPPFTPPALCPQRATWAWWASTPSSPPSSWTSMRPRCAPSCPTWRSGSTAVTGPSRLS